MPLRASSRQGAFHPRLIDSLLRAGFFPHTVSVEMKYETRLTSGGTRYGWRALVGMEAIPCIKYDRLPHEERTIELIEEVKYWTILLAGFFPVVDPTMRAKIFQTGEIFDIVGIDSASRGTYTVLTVRLPVPVAQPGV
jgi:hypothetical protein